MSDIDKGNDALREMFGVQFTPLARLYSDLNNAYQELLADLGTALELLAWCGANEGRDTDLGGAVNLPYYERCDALFEKYNLA